MMSVVIRAESWADVLSLLRGDLTAADRAGGWNDELRSNWLELLDGAWLGSRFLPSDAARLRRDLQVAGVTAGPIVEALRNAEGGLPGVGTSQAVATAVKTLSLGLRRFSFKGSAPHLQRQMDGDTLHLVHLQRVNAGVTGREPGFTLNLNVVHGALRRAWQRTGHWRAKKPVRSSNDTGIATRLGVLALGHDHWWRPSTDDEAQAAAAEVIELMEARGLPWLERLSDPENALAWLLEQPVNLVLLEVAAALVVELEQDDRMGEAERALRRWSRGTLVEDEPISDWLVKRLSRQQQLNGR